MRALASPVAVLRLGSWEKIALAATFLASQRASSITGAEVYVDAGSAQGVDFTSELIRRDKLNGDITMSAYLIFTRDKTLDQNEMATYSKGVEATVAGHPMKVLAFYGSHEDLEGAPTEGTVILEFPSVQAAKAWYDSPQYRELRQHRFKGATYRVTLVNGV